MSSLPAPIINNRFSDCVAMKLHFNWAQTEANKQPLPSFLSTHSQSTDETEIEVSLTINFSGEQAMKVPAGERLGFPNGEVTFGIKRGRLQLNLEACKMLLETINLSPTFKISLEVEQQVEKEFGASLGSKGVGNIQGKNKAAQKMTVETAQVKLTGSEENPGWIFQAQGNQHILEGILSQALLGILQQSSLPCKVEATFVVRGEDVHITWGNILLSKNIHRNKSAVIERALALGYIKPKIEAGPLSKVSWQHA